ncbi:MAG: exodeoxyribonuclease VII large subunit [Lachnospiraceae bacterium]
MQNREQNAYTVTKVNTYINNMFRQDYMLQSLFIKGEISNCKYHTSGHIYFTLKDTSSSISCVMYKKESMMLTFKLQDGMEVVLGGSVTVYEAQGKYQFCAKEAYKQGIGSLYETYEQLKKSLEEKGLFAKEYKQEIPKYIKTLGVVTAPTGAAVRDIIQIATRRNPYIQIILYPAIVQGDKAVSSIVHGIRALEQKKVDVMIVGRGGGSIEDLWAFNEELVAQAIFDCSVPIISAVGHETDTTIADYVADLRAPTPSAAAELAVYSVVDLFALLRTKRTELEKNITRKIMTKRHLVEQKKHLLQRQSPQNKVVEFRHSIVLKEDALQKFMEEKIKQKKHRVALYIERLKGLSPLEKLNQGYAFVSEKEGGAIHTISKVEVGKLYQIHVKDGYFTARAEEKKALTMEGDV